MPSVSVLPGRRLTRVARCAPLIALLCGACQGDGGEARPAEGGAPEAARAAVGAAPALGAVAGSIGAVSPDSLLAYARAQTYDTLESVGDEQYLTEGTCGANCRPGPRAAIQPQVETFRYKRSDIAGGRVIARIVNRDSVAYPALNLAPGDTTYWFVDSTATGWRSTFVSSSNAAQPVSRPLTIDRHPGQPHTQALARWKLTAAGVPVPWQSCVDEGCCR